MERMKRTNAFLAAGFAVVIAVGFVIALRTPEAARRIRNEVIYRLPVTLPGQPSCPGCNIIILNMDSLRAPELPCYGYTRNTAPNLCSFADRNIRFSRFYANSSYTLDSHTSMFTGLYPTSHHVIDALKDTLSDDIPTITQILKRNGYRNIWGGLTSDVNLPLDKGIGRDYDELHDLNGNAPTWERDYGELLKKLEDGVPTFLFLHTYAVHSPYLAGRRDRQFVPDKYPQIPVTREEFMPHTLPYYRFALDAFRQRLDASDTTESKTRNGEIVRALSEAVSGQDIERAREVLWALPEYENFELYFTWYQQQVDTDDPDVLAYYQGLYDEQIYKTDKQLRTLLDFVGREDIRRKTILIILSDNGEEFMEHGYLDHAWNIYNPATHVPFIMSAPRTVRGVYHDLAQITDIVPTLLDLTGVRADVPFDGMSLAPLLYGKGPQYVGDRYLVGQHRGDAVTSIRNSRWKMYKNNTPEKKYVELYDLVTDPGEKNNVLGTYMDTARLLDRALGMTLTSSPRYASGSGEFPRWLDREKRRSLIEEGYF